MAVIGIDLGTTNSLGCVYLEGGARLIPNALGQVLTPSVVSVAEDGSIYVGAAAKERLVTHPEATAASFKRYMGTGKLYDLAGRRFTPQELSSFVLRQIKEDAERFLGEEVTEAVVSVPAYFNDNQRYATREAGELAGLKVERLINEPSAAALAASRLRGKAEGSFLVFDFGGGTLDVTVVDYFDNVIEVIAVSGDNCLGGDDFDREIAGHFCKLHGLSYKELTPGEKASLLQYAEKCKRNLSDRKEVISVLKLRGEREMTLDNAGLAKLGEDLLDRAGQVVSRALDDSGRTIGDIDEIVLAGGSSKMPVVGFFLRNFSGRQPCTEIEPEEIVAIGVGIYAGIKERKGKLRDLVLTDVCPFTLGIEVMNPADDKNSIMSPIIRRNSILPCSRKGFYTNAVSYHSKIRIRVYQGEEYYCRDNICLGEFVLNITRKKRGKNKIEVCFTYDINGILLVEATDPEHGREERVILTNDMYKMNEDELQRRIKELEACKLMPPGGTRTELVLARGERLFRQMSGEKRRMAADVMGNIQKAMSTQDDWKVLNCVKEAEAVFDILEGKERRE